MRGLDFGTMWQIMQVFISTVLILYGPGTNLDVKSRLKESHVVVLSNPCAPAWTKTGKPLVWITLSNYYIIIDFCCDCYRREWRWRCFIPDSLGWWRANWLCRSWGHPMPNRASQLDFWWWQRDCLEMICVQRCWSPHK